MSHGIPRRVAHGEDGGGVIDRLRTVVRRVVDAVSRASAAEERDRDRGDAVVRLGDATFRPAGDGRFKRVHDEIQRLTSTLNPGWDGHRAARITPEAAEAAKAFLTHADNKFGISLPEPVVGALADGALGLVWRVKRDRSEREVEIIFMRRGNEFVVSDRDGREPTIEGHDVDVDELIRVVDRYVIN